MYQIDGNVSRSVSHLVMEMYIPTVGGADQRLAKFVNANLTACPGLKQPQFHFPNCQTSEIALASLL